MIISSQIMMHLFCRILTSFFIFISSDLIYHVIILDYEFQESKCNALEVLFYWDDVHMKIYFLWLGVFYDNVMLFAVFC